MSRDASPPVHPYESRSMPGVHKGRVTVTGLGTINLGIHHNNFHVFFGQDSADEDLDLSEVRGASGIGTFDVTVNERPDRLVQGGLASAPTTPSTQATGAGGTTAWRVNLSQIIAKFGGVAFEQAATADFLLANGNIGLINGDSVIAAIVLKNVSGTVSIDKVLGTAATTGTQTAPTDADITAALTAGAKWLRLANVTINRTADLTVTQTQDNTVRFTGKKAQTGVIVRFVAIEDSPVG